MILTNENPPTLSQPLDDTRAEFTPQEEYDLDSVDARLRSVFEDLLKFSRRTDYSCFAAFEATLFSRLMYFGCLLTALFLRAQQEAFDPADYLKKAPNSRHKPTCRRTLRAKFGKISYWRNYVETKTGQGFFPLDIHLELFADSFSPNVISLVTQLATRVSLKTATLICSAFLNWSPSQRSIGELVLGLGRHADSYMKEPLGDKESQEDIIVIEIDGKATPTATQDELNKRRRPHKTENGCPCGCQRHRGKKCRLKRGKHKRRKKGDKSKNGRSITLVAVYTLNRGSDGLLHGPMKKRIWGSYAPRAAMMDWAREEVKRRGFDPDSDKVHIVSDGEVTFGKGMAQRFPKATHALDVRHVEEKVWDIGRLLYQEGSEELSQWVEKQREILYNGKISLLLKRLEKLKQSIAQKGPGTKAKREKIGKTFSYIQKRRKMMAYDRFIEQDLVIASGVIEGAVRYVIGERMDCSGMRWIEGRAEMLLHLRCIELNGEWDRFFRWARDKIAGKQADELLNYRIRTSTPATLPEK